MSARPAPIAGVRRIAVVRASAIGDYVHALPALDALRSAYPCAEIVLLGRAWHAALLTGRPGPVDRVVVVPDDAGLAGGDDAFLDRHPFFAAMRAQRFDLAIQIHGGGRHSNPFVRRLGARVSAGLAAPDAPALDRCLPYVYFQHEVVRCLEAVALVGAHAHRLAPSFPATPGDLAASLALLRSAARPLAVLNPGATDPRRRWPAERFVEVGRALVDAGAEVAVNGDASERSLCAAVAAGIGGDAFDLSGRAPLVALVGLLARAAVVVSNDTGPLHLADALGRRTVGLFWAFNLANTCPLLRERHRPFAAWDPFCPECGEDNARTRCPHDPSFVASIDAGPVRDAALAWLEDASRGALAA